MRCAHCLFLTTMVVFPACMPNSESTREMGTAPRTRDPGPPEPAGPVECASAEDCHPQQAGPVECASAEDCHPQQAGHGTWCGPTEHDFTHASVDAVFVPGTLDGTYHKGSGERVGCRCVEGRCGAMLNDGRLVVGPQPEIYSVDDGESGGPAD